MEIKGDDLLFLFGAGASVDAGIPMSNAMVQKIEELIIEHDEWKPYKVVLLLKSSISILMVF
ncbi:hypothetical protein RJT03_14970 [Bacteroides thetaiotaomicron]|uniref:hypothetical protein n=1 Tax=Bacteroides thetaiotaomicron TaxID=818 RepID=UPI0028F458A8|nr:hypothetical protein [Bacteroides thetaiotaomicron]WOG41811.1 hypothetical protein RJT03_14970 [Bacteroides thetaiotaomicron]